MTLLSLICDNPRFKALNFNKDLNIVVGKQLNHDQKDTVNGIGKSLSLEMLHYMLNAKIPQKMKDFLKENLHLIYNIQTKQQMQDYKIMSCNTHERTSYKTI